MGILWPKVFHPGQREVEKAQRGEQKEGSTLITYLQVGVYELQVKVWS